jgi:hypothetical protein
MSLEASPLSDQLPLFQLRDFDVLLNQSWPVGVDSDYPSELRVRLSAASISFQMGNKSVDHVVKRYLTDVTYKESPTDRLDKRIAHSLKLQLGKLDKILIELEPKNSVLGQMVSKWTFMRVPFSFDFAITCAQRGALFECLAIVRMILEQVAWSLDVRFLDDFHAITSRQASQSIGAMRSIHPAAGKFYGWLSDHAHWSYGAHIKAFESGGGTIGMRLANPLYKAQSLGAILVLFAITQAGYRCLHETLGCTSSAEEASEIDASSFIRELQSLAPEDRDIQHLLKMVETKHHES